MDIEERKDGVFKRWLLEKEERFYFLFLVAVFIFFMLMSMLNFALITGGIIAAFWLVFYFALIKRK